MTKSEKQFIIACVLGDGCINMRYTNGKPYYRFLLKHCTAQKDYLLSKISLLEPILTKYSKKSRIRTNDDIFHSEMHIALKSVKETEAICYQKGCTELKHIYHLIYKNNVKTFSRDVLNFLTPEGLAIWYMDDGSTYNVPNRQYNKYYKLRATLNTYLSYEDNLIIVNYFQDVWNVKWNITKDKNSYRLQCGTREFIKFREIILPYIVPCMQYKVELKMGQKVINSAIPQTGDAEGEDIVQI
jgi:hypothetical protein